MTRLSDEEIIESYFTEEKLERFRGLDELVKKAIALDVIGGVRLADSIYIPQIEKLQGEIERLKPFASAYENINEYFCGEDIVAKYESLQLELAQLTAKHDRLVKGLNDNFSWVKGLSEFLTEEGNV